MLRLDALELDGDLLAARQIRTQINVPEGPRADLAAEAVLLAHAELHRPRLRVRRAPGACLEAVRGVAARRASRLRASAAAFRPWGASRPSPGTARSCGYFLRACLALQRSATAPLASAIQPRAAPRRLCATRGRRVDVGRVAARTGRSESEGERRSTGLASACFGAATQRYACCPRQSHFTCSRRPVSARARLF